MTVKEEVPIGTVIGQLEAIDEDIGENAAIDYAITGKKKHYFHNVTPAYKILNETKIKNICLLFFQWETTSVC